MVAHDLYEFLERWAPVQVFWSSVFTAITAARAARRLRAREGAFHDSAILTEAAGFPLTAVQSVAFVWAALRGDVLSMLLFLWWGPGLIATVALVLLKKKRVMYRLRIPISWACKIAYLVYIAVFATMGMPQAIFAFSVWILNDQVEKAYLSEDADRTRRTTHDVWLFRVLYPAGLGVPWVVPVAFPVFFRVYGLALFALWIGGLAFVARRRKFRTLPEDPTLWRNILYAKPETYD